MNLIFIYGPPAAGKLTVSEALGKKIGYKVFHNQKIINSISDIFPFEDENLEPILKRLSAKFRLEIYEEAAKNGINFITTYGGGSTAQFGLFKSVKEVVEKNGGNVYFVQLLPSHDTLMDRVCSKSRMGFKIDNVDYLKAQLAKHPEYSQKFPDVEHITIDNTDMSPEEVADEIIANCELD